MLTINGITVRLGGRTILDRATAAIPPGAAVGLIGRNGAGKSTLLKSLMNAGPQVTGEVAWQGKRLGNSPSYQRARLGLQLVPEDRRIYHHLTVRENVKIAEHARPRGTAKPDPDSIIDRFPMLQALKERLGYQLSGGQQQVLAIARALAASPKIMLLDEPTEGVAPTIVEEMVRTIRALCEQTGMGLLLCEQNLWFARQLTDRVAVIDTGRIVFDGSWAEFIARPEIKDKHLAI